MRVFFFILFLLCTSQKLLGQAVAKPKIKDPKETKNESLNQTDTNGKRTGKWWLKALGESGESHYEYGAYEQGRKYGKWLKLDKEGNLIASETYANNVLDGEAKYYEDGLLYCTGTYRGVNPTHAFDTILVIDPVTGLEIEKVIATEGGTTRHGTWRFFDPETGVVIREEEYQVDVMLFHKEFPNLGNDSSTNGKENKNQPKRKAEKVRPPRGKEFSYMKGE